MLHLFAAHFLINRLLIFGAQVHSPNMIRLEDLGWQVVIGYMRHSPEIYSDALVRQPASDNTSDINDEMVNVDVFEAREFMRNPVVRHNSAFHDDR
ncbi:MAG: hypothetical protein DMG36_02635 [Acidobacteria bacterium]|nr:MAG: hypothetical protein DMG36_02635 [Acidobacteriota bacterium]